MQLAALYRPILKRALGIVWRHKVLWFLGFFAALLGGSGEIDILVGGLNNVSWGTLFGETAKEVVLKGGLVEFLTDMRARFSTIPGAGIVVLATFLGALIIFLGLFIVSQIILINRTATYAQGLVQGKESGLKIVKRYFWKILGLNIINKGVIFGLFILLGLISLSIVNKTSGLVAVILMIIFYIVLLSLCINVSFITRYASFYIILTGERLGQALRNGRGLFFRNWLVSMEMAGILFGLNIIVGLLMMALSIIVAYPFMVGSEVFIDMGTTGKAWSTMIAGSVVGLLILVIFGAIFVSFNYAVWTLLFLRVNSSQKQLSRLVRWVARLGR